ncbi:hypothetical protein SpCBS45565_g07970 [Spizellomyces sp. 'palustris']|nr:hypothetical protein SpCBS45565_g07970 [Spizellomyces sp. 'palustris']
MQLLTFPLLLLPLLASAAPTGAFKICTADTNKAISLKSYGEHKAALPYSVHLPQNIKTYDPNTPIEVTISGIASYTEIVLYAAQFQYHQNHTGTWVELNDDYTTLDGNDEKADPAGCGSYGKGATLSSKNDKQKNLPVTLKWLPPVQPLNDSIKFYGIVVQGGNQGFKMVTTDVGVTAANPWPETKRQNSATRHAAAASTLLVIAGALVTTFII